MVIVTENIPTKYLVDGHIKIELDKIIKIVEYCPECLNSFQEHCKHVDEEIKHYLLSQDVVKYDKDWDSWGISDNYYNFLEKLINLKYK